MRATMRQMIFCHQKLEGGRGIRAYLAMVSLILTTISCTASLSPSAVKSGKEGADAFAITDRKPFVAGPGDVVTIIGVSFRPTMGLSSDLPATFVFQPVVTSSTQATFVMPPNLPFGLITIVARQDSAQQKFSIFSNGGKIDQPIITSDRATVCLGIKFYDATGSSQTGTKDCRPTVELPDCSQDGAIGCVASSSFRAAEMSRVTPAAIISGQVIAGVTGVLTAETHSDCATDGAVGCVATASWRAADMSVAVPSNIAQGQKIAGVAGSLIPSPAACGADGASDCVVDGSLYRAAALANFSAANIVTGITVAGRAGSLANCSVDGGIGCVAVATYPASKLANFTNGDIRTGVQIAGVVGVLSGSPAACVADGTNGCLTTASFPAAAKAGLTDKVLLGQTVGGVAGDVVLPAANAVATSVQYGVSGTGLTGTLTLPAATNVRTSNGAYGIGGNSLVPSLADCASDGATGCVTIGTFKAADMNLAIPGNIKTGVTIAAVLGAYPSAGSKLPSAGGQAGLTSLAANTAAGTYEWWDGSGGYHTGLVLDAGTVAPTGLSQAFNAGVYRQFSVGGDANLTAGNVKAGVTVYGVSGQYPSATYPLPNAGLGGIGTDLTTAQLASAMRSGGSVEWYDSSGTRYTGTGDANIVAANIKSGVTVFGVAGVLTAGSACTGDGQINCLATSTYVSANTNAVIAPDIRVGKTIAGIAGTLMTNCRNTVNSALYNFDGTVATLDNNSHTGGTVSDIWDTVDDFSGFPGEAVPAWPNSDCNIANWTDVTPGGSCAGNAANCMYQDHTTGLAVTKSIGSSAWAEAVNACNNSNYGGLAGWRLPTQKEAMQLSIDGIVSLAGANFMTLAAMQGAFWTASTNSPQTTNAWRIIMADGYGATNKAKTMIYGTICVQP